MPATSPMIVAISMPVPKNAARKLAKPPEAENTAAALTGFFLA